VQTSAPALKVRVRRIVDETADIKSFELESADGSALPAWSAGAHIDVRLDHETVRQYSLCGASGARDAYRIAVKNVPDSRGGSRAMHQRVSVGDTLVIGGPRREAALESRTADHVCMPPSRSFARWNPSAFKSSDPPMASSRRMAKLVRLCIESAGLGTS
jgi:ferredoxin-NADP reductase